MNISCKHVKSSLESCTTKAKIQNVDEDILKRLDITDERRKILLTMHKESKSAMPLVQRINQRVFVVCCDVSLNFPIGLLHVICIAEENFIRCVFSFNCNPIETNIMCLFFFCSFCCACQKTTILSISNKSTLQGTDICDHILLIFAAILSDQNLQNEFEYLAAIIKLSLNNTIDECQWLSDVSY